MQLCFVSVHGPRETYFVDEPRKLRLNTDEIAIIVGARTSRFEYRLLRRELDVSAVQSLASSQHKINFPATSIGFLLRLLTTKLRGLSPRANNTDRATTACRLS
jgi:hypothetical protein